MATIAVATGGLVFIILYLGFYATRFPWYENLAVILSTVIVVPVVLLVIWVAWGLGLHSRYLKGYGQDL